MTHRYVLGFVFTPNLTRVLLLLKNRPEWQRGRWNGVGGHVEARESFDDAMDREGKEEIGFTLVWQRFAVLEGINNDGIEFRCVCYRGITVAGLAPVSNDVGETFEWFDAEKLPNECIGNLFWLVPLAQDIHGGLRIVRAHYDHPARDAAEQSLR